MSFQFVSSQVVAPFFFWKILNYRGSRYARVIKEAIENRNTGHEDHNVT